MIQNTKSQNVFCVIVLRSDGSSVILDKTTQLPIGSSDPSAWIDFPTASAVRAGYTEIGDYIGVQELDEQRRSLLERARRGMAQKVYADKPEAILRRFRLARGWSQSTLAKEIGTTQAQIARIESAETDPQASTLERLGKALGEPPDVILRAFLTVKKARQSTGNDG